MTERLLLSIPQAADALGIGKDLAWELVHSGELPTVHIHRRRLVRTADLAAYVEQLPPDLGYVETLRQGTDDHRRRVVVVPARESAGARRHPR